MFANCFYLQFKKLVNRSTCIYNISTLLKLLLRALEASKLENESANAFFDSDTSSNSASTTSTSTSYRQLPDDVTALNGSFLNHKVSILPTSFFGDLQKTRPFKMINIYKWICFFVTSPKQSDRKN